MDVAGLENVPIEPLDRSGLVGTLVADTYKWQDGQAG